MTSPAEPAMKPRRVRRMAILITFWLWSAPLNAQTVHPASCKLTRDWQTGKQKGRARVPWRGLFFALSRGSEVFAVLGCAHFVEEFRDLEFGGGFGFGGEFLDGFAGGLQFRFFG